MDKKTIWGIIIIVIIAGAFFFFNKNDNGDTVIVNDFNSCIEAGNPAMESYPRQCSDGENHFVEVLPTEPDGGIGDGEIISLPTDNIPTEPDNGIGDGAQPLDELLGE